MSKRESLITSGWKGLDIMRQKLRLTIALVLLVAGSALQAQNSALKSSEATAFLGTWAIAMTNPSGAQETVRIVEKDGIVAASVP